MARLNRTSQKTAKKKCDALFSRIVRSLGYCENCQKSRGVQLQCAHLMSRRYSHTRTSFRNAYALCAKCHRHFHDYPREFSHFINSTILGKHYDETYALAQSRTKFDWMTRHEELKQILEQVENGDTSLIELRL